MRFELLTLFIFLTLLIYIFFIFFGLIPTFDINIFFGLCFVLLITLVATQIAKRNRLGRKRRKRRSASKSKTRWSTNWKETPERTPIDDKTRHAVLVRAKYRCENCGVKYEEAQDGYLQMDHIRPVDKGGPDDLDNLQALCIPCNKEKGNKFDGEGHSYRDYSEE